MRSELTSLEASFHASTGAAAYDAIGFSMLFPQLRARLAQKTVGSLATARPDLKQPVVIEGDYERKS